jgi:general secretion pathway protein D
MPPDVRENKIVSTIRLKDGYSVLLGGLITSEDSFRVNGVPILKEIPLIKYLFSSKEKISNKKELIFIITPHIIKNIKKIN